jgi:hypothetical protein
MLEQGAEPQRGAPPSQNTGLDTLPGLEVNLYKQSNKYLGRNQETLVKEKHSKESK